MSFTPYFDRLMSQVRDEDRPLVKSMLYAIMFNRRGTKHFVLEGTSPYIASLVRLAQALAPMEFGHLTNCVNPRFWMEKLFELRPKGTEGGVECWSADAIYSSIWSKEHRVLIQKPILVHSIDKNTLIRASSLSIRNARGMNMMVIANREHKVPIGFYEWTSPVVVLASKPVDLDPNLFCTIHLDKADQHDPEFHLKLINEKECIKNILNPQE
jgi:hypothetical protein